jgi:hypothetical protein
MSTRNEILTGLYIDKVEITLDSTFTNFCFLEKQAGATRSATAAIPLARATEVLSRNCRVPRSPYERMACLWLSCGYVNWISTPLAG